MGDVGASVGAFAPVALTPVVESLRREMEHSISYFNELAGGPENGSAHLLDSNIDWG